MNAFTGNVLPLLHEVRHALERLLATGEETTIDLGALPLAPGEFDRIVEELGQGAVTAVLNALGLSEIRETRYSGVWLVTHRNVTDEVMGRYLQMANVPTRSDILSLGERLSALEERLIRIEAMLTKSVAVAAAGGSAPNASAAAAKPRPPRTRKPQKA